MAVSLPPGFKVVNGKIVPSIGGPLGSNVTAAPGTSLATSPQMMDIGGGTDPMTALLGGGNPYWRAAMAAAGVMAPTPTAANDTISPEMAGQLPQHPPSTGVMPGQWHSGSPTNPVIPSPDDSVNPYTAAANAPTSPTAMPWRGPIADQPAGDAGMQRGGVSAPPAPANINLGRGMPGPGQPAAAQVVSPFTQVDRPNMSAAGGARGNPGATQMSALDLSRFFQHPAVQQAMAAASASGAQNVPLSQTPLPPPRPQAQGPMDPEIIARIAQGQQL
jgi:hypothetical protein